jgi:hypothetical protein
MTDPKLPHWFVAYESPAAGMHHCSECAHWLGPRPGGDSCAIVRPPVRAGDWCNRWKAKP